MSACEAREAALRMLGGVSQIEEECREMRGTQYLENLCQDLRYAVRTLGKNPAFASVIILTKPHDVPAFLRDIVVEL